MSEANQNAPFDSESILPREDDHFEQHNEIAETAGEFVVENSHSQLEPSDRPASDRTQNSSKSEDPESSTQKMNWQKVAHKLREYNRKLLKKVFRLEQELAEIDNKFNKYVEKSQNSDLLLAHQAEEIKSYQEQVALLTQQLAGSQQQLNSQESIIDRVSEQRELSQKQAAQLERECTLLQEKYNHKAFELVAREQEAQELQTQLSQQQRHALQREAELKRYQEAEVSRKDKAVNRQNYPHNRYIQPWSTSTIPEPKIALPRTKSKLAKVKESENTVETIKTAAEIATWSTSISAKKPDKSKVNKAQPAQNKKPQSLAAVDLPTFPRS